MRSYTAILEDGTRVAIAARTVRAAMRLLQGTPWITILSPSRLRREDHVSFAGLAALLVERG